MIDIITENKLSKNLAAPFIAAFNKLGFTEKEANYFMSLYHQLRKNNLLDARYFKPVKPGEEKYKEYVDNNGVVHNNLEPNQTIVDYEGKLPDIKQLQVLAQRDPDALVDFFTYIIHNEHFLKAYNLGIDENTGDVELTKVTQEEELKKQKEEERAEKVKTIYNPDNNLVAFDDNWATYAPRTSAEGMKIKKEFFRHGLTQEQLKELYNIPEDFNIAYLEPSWCVISSSTTGYFDSYRRNDMNAQWLITYRRLNALQIYEMYVKDKPTIRLFSTEIGDKYIGEIYLRSGQHKVTPVGENNYGHYPFSNSGHPLKTSRLINGPSYDLDTLQSAEKEDFEIEKGVLKKVNIDEEVINVPLGVTKIGRGAFTTKDNSRVEKIILPITTVVIETGAIDLPNLRFINATNNLRVVERDALIKIVQLDNDLGVVYIGVTEDGNHYEKPKKLIYMQRNLLNEYKRGGGMTNV